jgi:cellulose synthase/poly-beta-1,6-N-acetylglucosamine synthase-like glycosyltransferase
MMMKTIFWLAFAGTVYAYFVYPLLLALLARINPKNLRLVPNTDLPSVSILIPAHNEEAIIAKKLANTVALDYPRDKLEMVVVSDGSTDSTDNIVKGFHADCPLQFFRVESRKGKANALNTGLQHVSGEVIIFSDSSIMLEKNALKAVTKAFADPKVGCISGEDHIPEGGGEGLYGRYELYLRNLESRIGSIVGASGSFYAQRRQLCTPFVEGLAPDFLSVLNSVEQGYRAISEPNAKGIMSAISDTGAEYRRKVRTLLRGMTTLWTKRSLMNPLRNATFAFVLVSHKLMRWLVPLFLLAMVVANIYLLSSGFYLGLFALQLLFYGLAMMAWLKVGRFDQRLFGKVPLYFTVVNVAILQAWLLFLRGVRQEIWEPSKRVS